jgi:hypothetical protein
VSSDHGTGPTPVVRKLNRRVFSRERLAHYAPVPLLLHDPLHDLPARIAVHAGTIDLAPTILHMLGLPGRHAMLGASLFGERRERRLLVGRIGPESLWISSRAGQRVLRIASLAGACDARRPLGLPVELDACDLGAWVRFTDSLWNADRLVPGPR